MDNLDGVTLTCFELVTKLNTEKWHLSPGKDELGLAEYLQSANALVVGAETNGKKLTLPHTGMGDFAEPGVVEPSRIIQQGRRIYIYDSNENNQQRLLFSLLAQDLVMENLWGSNSSISVLAGITLWCAGHRIAYAKQDNNGKHMILYFDNGDILKIGARRKNNSAGLSMEAFNAHGKRIANKYIIKYPPKKT